MQRHSRTERLIHTPRRGLKIDRSRAKIIFFRDCSSGKYAFLL